MSEKKHIDRLFQEKFKDFESQPPASAWEGIKSQLATPSKKDRKLIPIWWRVAGVAALLALIFTAINFWGPDTKTEQFVDTNTEQIDITNDANDAVVSEDDAVKAAGIKDETSKDEFDINDLETNPETIANSDGDTNEQQTKYYNNKTTAKDLIKTDSDNLIEDDVNSANAVVNADNQSNKTDGISGVDAQNNSASNEALINKDAVTNTLENNSNDAVGVANNDDVQNDAANTTQDTNNVSGEIEDGKVDINEYIANKEEQEAIAQEESELKKQETNAKRWGITPQVAPVFYGSLGDGSSISPEFSDNAKSSETNISYGVQVSYNVNDRFSIRSGVNKLNLSYNTNDIEFAVNPSNVALSGTKFVYGDISYSVGDKGTLQNQFAVAVPGTEDAAPVTLDAFQGQLNQQLEYWEVPVEMSYALIDNRFRLNLVGGFSSLILQDNQLVAISGDREAKLGSADNLNSFSFTTNVGVGLNYNITDQFRVNMEPMFKYQLNPYADTAVDFKPYYMGIYTGLSFSF